MLAIIKKELKNYFLSPIGYIVIGIFLIAFSAFFYLTSIQSASVDLTYLFYYTALYGLMFITPLVTMWTISGERKNGTDQLIMTAPVSMFGVVIAKFISAMLLILIPVLCTLMYFGILCFFQVPDIPTYLTSMLGFILLSMAYISFGILASSLTESPIIAGILTFGFVFASTWLPYFVSALSGLSLMDLFIKFLYGQIDITATVFLVTLAILCLTITMVIMQRRKSVK
jgi:ABC-2 type transport system permease protein